MDALGGYGSDSSSSSSAALDKTAAPNPTAVSKSESGLARLIGNASDASDDEQDAKLKVQELRASGLPPAKRSKVETPSTKSSGSSKLPLPALSKDENNDCYVHWKTNYLHQSVSKEDQLSLSETPKVQEIQRNLDRLSQSLSTLNKEREKTLGGTGSNGSSWADHLKSQHEFHNPHLFKSVVDHFGIQDPLGSCVSPRDGMMKTDPSVKEYERRLFPLAMSTVEDATGVN